MSRCTAGGVLCRRLGVGATIDLANSGGIVGMITLRTARDGVVAGGASAIERQMSGLGGAAWAVAARMRLSGCCGGVGCFWCCGL
jgi:hypothetical protein